MGDYAFEGVTNILGGSVRIGGTIDPTTDFNLGDGGALDIKGYVTEAKIGEGSPAIGKTVAEFVERHDHAVGVMSVLWSGLRSFPSPDIVLCDEDTLILGGDTEARSEEHTSELQ